MSIKTKVVSNTYDSCILKGPFFVLNHTALPLSYGGELIKKYGYVCPIYLNSWHANKNIKTDISQ